MGQKSVIILSILLSVSLWSQQETQFWLAPYQLNTVNPAVVGMEGNPQLILHSNSQWTSIEDAPRTFAFSYATKTSNKLGIGINFVSDQVYVEKQTQAFVDFSYPLQLSGDLFLQLGLKGGGNFYNAAAQNLRFTGSNFDPAQRSINTFRPNIGAGLYLQYQTFWLSLSQPNLIAHTLDDIEWVQAQDRVHTYAALGFDYLFTESWSFKPSLQLQKVKGLPHLYTFGVAFAYQKKADFGLTRRSTGEWGLLTFFPISSKIFVGYAFAQPTNKKLSGLQVRSHEVLLKFTLAEGKDRVAFEKENQ